MKHFYCVAYTLLLVTVLCTLQVGCTSSDVQLVSRPPEKATKLGPARGTASGVLVFGILPFGTNTRTYRAYKDALAQVPEATMLTDVAVEEFWLNLGIGLFQQVIITGEAVK